jgi:hydrogenase/urease accessory protein HupE
MDRSKAGALFPDFLGACLREHCSIHGLFCLTWGSLVMCGMDHLGWVVAVGLDVMARFEEVSVSKTWFVMKTIGQLQALANSFVEE